MSYVKPTIVYGEASKVYACKQGACNGPDNIYKITIDEESEKKDLQEKRAA